VQSRPSVRISTCRRLAKRGSCVVAKPRSSACRWRTSAAGVSATMAIVRITVIGTGLMGTSVALAAQARGDDVRGWDPDPDVLQRAARGLTPARSLEEAAEGADPGVVAAPLAQPPCVPR